MPSAVIENGSPLDGGPCDSQSVKIGAHASQPDSIPTHPLGVKPLGNQYLFQGVNARRSTGIWDTLPDEILMVIFEYFDVQGLFALGHTCKFLYAFCHSEELWKTLFLQ